LQNTKFYRRIFGYNYNTLNMCFYFVSQFVGAEGLVNMVIKTLELLWL